MLQNKWPKKYDTRMEISRNDYILFSIVPFFVTFLTNKYYIDFSYLDASSQLTVTVLQNLSLEVIRSKVMCLVLVS